MAKTAQKDVTVIWHLGFQKTGTTIFQSLMRRNQDALENHCAVFPKRHWTQAVQDAGLAFWADPSDATEDALSQAARDICAAIQDKGHTHGIVSDENIIGLDLYDQKGGMIDMAASVIPVLERAILPAKSVFVFYTRDWDDWFKSAHNQVVKQMRSRLDHDDFCANAPFERDWDKHYKRLQSVVSGEVVFRAMEEDARESWPMGGYMLTRAGVPSSLFANLTKPIGKNQSLPPSALNFMLEINRSHINEHGLAVVRKKVLKHIRAFR